MNEIRTHDHMGKVSKFLDTKAFNHSSINHFHFFKIIQNKSNIKQQYPNPVCPMQPPLYDISACGLSFIFMIFHFISEINRVCSANTQKKMCNKKFFSYTFYDTRAE